MGKACDSTSPLATVLISQFLFIAKLPKRVLYTPYLKFCFQLISKPLQSGVHTQNSSERSFVKVTGELHVVKYNDPFSILNFIDCSVAFDN